MLTQRFINGFGSLSLCPPPISLVTLCPSREKECLWLIYIYLLLANLTIQWLLFCQSVDLVITNDTFYWFSLSKSPLSQSEALLDKSRSALLECAIHVFNKRFTMSTLFDVGGI